MGAFISSAWAIFILLAIGAIGYYMIARNIIPGEALKYISSLSTELAIPLFIFSNLVLKFDPSTSPGWWKLPLWWVAFAAVTLVIAVALSKLFKKDIRREAVVSLYLYNPTFVPLSVIIGLFGIDSPYVVDLFLFSIFSGMFYFNVYKVFFRKGAKLALPSLSSIDWKKVFNPFVKVTLLALIITLSGAGAYIPEAFFSVTEHIGAMAFPLIMLIFGGYIYLDMKNSGKIYWKEAIKFTAFKNLLFPLIFLGLIYLIKPAYNVALMLMLSAAAPPLSAVPILIERQGGNTQISNQFMVGSFLFSIVSMPVMLVLLNAVYQGIA